MNSQGYNKTLQVYARNSEAKTSQGSQKGSESWVLFRC